MSSPLMDSLPPKQRDVLEQLLAFIRDNGYPPSIQQLCQLCGVSSTSTIHYHLSALKKKGFIDWNPAEKRAISIHADIREEFGETAVEEETPETDNVRGMIPMLGAIAAGQPLMTENHLGSGMERINLSEDLCPSGCYALRVRGTSMIEDHIVDEDIVIINPNVTVRDGDVVVALVENQSATLKRLYREKNRVRLQPANSEMEPIYVTDVQVQGRVETIIRRL